MYVTTFYSYKGGVGRSLALANVAAELASHSKTVLIVDFDLEAPGITSFDFGLKSGSEDNSLGVVDFVDRYVVDGFAPDVRDYVYQCGPAPDSSGRILVMPAGKLDGRYGSRLNRIDFRDLYENQNGFLLFEDLKAQWRDLLGVDYVLIDSRTGHTDIGGVCTRQLPNLVAFVFWPNAQNLSGLKLIIDEMDQGDPDRRISRLFVPSNLPTLDDESQQLRGLLRRFRNTLKYSLPQEVQLHNYPSLDLLEQTLFVTKRPTTRLARQYVELTHAIQRHNLADEQGVRLYLKRLEPRAPLPRPLVLDRSTAGRVERRLDELEKRRWKDPEIVRSLSVIRAAEGEFDSAVRLVTELIRNGQSALPDYLNLAEWYGRTASSIDLDIGETVDRLLDDEQAGSRHVVAALELLDANPGLMRDGIGGLSDRPAIRRLTAVDVDPICRWGKNSSRKSAVVASILRDVFVRAVGPESKERSNAEHEFILTLIAAGDFAAAVDILTDRLQSDEPENIRFAFNLGVALWGRNGEAPVEQFRKVMILHDGASPPERIISPNYPQCLALACGVLGHSARAMEFVEIARTQIAGLPGDFSCWSYLSRGRKVFLTEIAELEEWIQSGQPTPRFLHPDVPAEVAQP